MAATEGIVLIPCVYRVQGATPRECQTFTAQYKLNLNGCCENSRAKGCASPYRLCIRCHLEKRTNAKLELATVVNPATGLCYRHSLIHDIERKKHVTKRVTRGRGEAKKRPRGSFYDPPDHVLEEYERIENKPDQIVRTVIAYKQATAGLGEAPTVHDLVAAVEYLCTHLKLGIVGQLFGKRSISAQAWASKVRTLGTFVSVEWTMIDSMRPHPSLSAVSELRLSLEYKSRDERLRIVRAFAQQSAEAD